MYSKFSDAMMKTTYTGAQLVVKCLEAQNVKYVFGIPGAKVDAIYNALLDSSIRLILCRHEQNATFMAAAYGRITQQPGVVLVTSGPGVSNLITGLLTATTEGDPVVALGGNVELCMRLKSTHQQADNVKLTEASTKSSVEILNVQSIPEVIASAFQHAQAPRKGACFVSFPADILHHETDTLVLLPYQPPRTRACDTDIDEAVHLISSAQFPVLLLGEQASQEQNAKAIHALLAKTHFPTVCTFQGAGVVPLSLIHCFAGRVGLFQNQPGDQLLKQADLIITIGFHGIEYDPEVWAAGSKAHILHIDTVDVELRQFYQPTCQVIGSIDLNVAQLTKKLPQLNTEHYQSLVAPYHKELMDLIQQTVHHKKDSIHPLEFIRTLHQCVDENTRIICDVGSIYMWFARHYLSTKARHLLFSNGQQTLGIGLPWAIASHLAQPDKTVISLSGDGGFLFSAVELETAVREKCRIIHFVWSDQSYNMVAEQEFIKYGRVSGIGLGQIDYVKFAESFGAVGYMLTDVTELPSLLNKALQEEKPVLIGVFIDYSDNHHLFELLHPSLNH